MIRLLYATLILICLAAPGASVGAQTAPPSATAASPAVGIQSPMPGEALQGTVVITGTTSVEGFQSFDLMFAYADRLSGTWFPLTHSDQAVTSGTLAEWDTTIITDGRYNLLLVVHLADGTQRSITVEGLRVRNYSPVETSTPAPPTLTPTLAPQATRAATITPTPTITPIPPTATPLPPNPAQMGMGDVVASLGGGVIIALGLFLVIGLYLLIRNLFIRW